MSATPDWAGQVYKDTGNGNIWRANSTTPGDWTLEVQDTKSFWSPRTSMLMDYMFLSSYGSNVDLTDIAIGVEASNEGIDWEFDLVVVNLSCPNLVTCNGNIIVSDCDNLLSLSFPQLVTCTGNISLGTNSLLQSINLDYLVSTSPGKTIEASDCSIASLSIPNLITCGGLSFSNNLITSVSFPNYVPTNGTVISFTGNALTLASVNHILSICVANPIYVSGTIAINGGTNAACPTGAGTDHDILVGRGVVINHN